MKLPAIKKLIEQYDLATCRQAETDLLEGNPLQIEVEGNDEGEQLTHILAAIDVLEKVQQENMDPKVALREFFERVRRSIS